MSQKRRRINARMPEPNDNFSMTVGNKVIVDAVFRDTGLDCFLDGLKRNQGESVSNEIKALVANSIDDRDLSQQVGQANGEPAFPYGVRTGRRSRQVRVPYCGESGGAFRRDRSVPGKEIEAKLWRRNGYSVHRLDLDVFRGASERFRPCGVFKGSSAGQAAGNSRIGDGQGFRHADRTDDKPWEHHGRHPFCLAG